MIVGARGHEQTYLKQPLCLLYGERIQQDQRDKVGGYDCHPGRKDDNVKCGLGAPCGLASLSFQSCTSLSLSAVLASCFLKNMMALLVFRPLHVRSLCLVLLSSMLFAFDLYSSCKLEVGCGFFRKVFSGIFHLQTHGCPVAESSTCSAAISYLMPPPPS